MTKTIFYFYCILYFIVFYILLYITIHNISQVFVQSFYSMLLILFTHLLLTGVVYFD